VRIGVPGPNKRNRYTTARGENGEAAAAVEFAGACELLDSHTTDELLDDANRISAMLLNLTRRRPLPLDGSPSESSET
jgi:hypothetical protein